MNKAKILFLLILAAILLCACSEKKQTVTAGTYLYDYNDTADSKLVSYFHITIKNDGTFSYCESVSLSSATTGTWSVSDGILTLSDECGNHNFLISDNNISFISDGSDNFTHVNVKDGETFTLIGSE